jgi:protein ImuB
MNAAAYNIGIRPGSSMNTAYTLSDHLVSFERNEEKEYAVLSQLAQWAYRFTPNVSIKAPGSLLLEISGCLKLFNGLDNLKSLIQKGLNDLGFSAVPGVNGTPAAALCFAEAGMGDNTGDVSTSVKPVPIEFLGIDDNIRQSLHQMGISHTRQLLELPKDGLNRRFGVFFTDYLQRLIGDKPDPRKFISDKPRFDSELTFLSDITNTESLIFPMKRLLGELQDFLRGRQLLVNQFSFRLAHRSHEPRIFTVLLANPDNDARMFLMLSQLQLEKITDMPETDSISLSAKTFFEPETQSGDLFHGTKFHQKDGRIHSKAQEDHAVRLLNMMTARLGPQACFGLSLANDHRPELAWKPVALSAPVARDAFPMAGDIARPLYLLPEPRKLDSVSGKPRMAGRLELLQGPERIEFGWWDNNEVSRDYFIARHNCGALYWVYRQLDNECWFLHGIFS